MTKTEIAELKAYVDSKTTITMSMDVEQLLLLIEQHEKALAVIEYYSELTNWYDPREIDGSDQNGIWRDSENILIHSIQKYKTIGGKRARDFLRSVGDSSN